MCFGPATFPRCGTGPLLRLSVRQHETETTAIKDLFTTWDNAMLLIDHQVGIIKLAISTPLDELVRNTRALARTAVEVGMPLVLTSSQED